MYDNNFIERVKKAYNKRNYLCLTVKNIANIFGISKQTIYNWLSNKYSLKDGKRILTKNTQPITKKYISYVTKYVIRNPQFKMKDLLKNLNLLFGIGISKQTIYNILASNNITLKRVRVNRYPHKLCKYKQEVRNLREIIDSNKNKIISIDETGIQLNAVNNYGWSYKGEPCIIEKPLKSKDVRFSLLFGFSNNRIIDYTLKEGSINGEDFKNYMIKIKSKSRNYKFLMDNARIHHAKILGDTIKNRIIYNVPYSPQFNPIEYVNNEIKRQIKSLTINNKQDLIDNLERIFEELNTKKYKKYFEKSYKDLEEACK